uniref:Ig-like domain-containing protein n=1 Tax=Urocitellus parryii TaxID=9999 RepID=A0A8D2I6Z0_UROPR
SESKISEPQYFGTRLRIWTVTLTCGSSTGAVTTSNYANWIQQKPYQVPHDIIGSTSYRVSGVPAKFSGSLLGNKTAFTITGVQTEDEADYYCQVKCVNSHDATAE